MKKIILGGVLAAILFCAPLVTSASTPTIAELQQQISNLLAQIQTLQTQLLALSGETTGSTGSTSGTEGSWCHTFSANLKMGDENGDVNHLRTALFKSGIGTNSNTPNVFDEGLASAVVAFQEKFASEILVPANLTKGSGYVGQLTRNKLNALYGCSSNGSGSTDSSTSILYISKGTTNSSPLRTPVMTDYPIATIRLQASGEYIKPSKIVFDLPLNHQIIEKVSLFDEDNGMVIGEESVTDGIPSVEMVINNFNGVVKDFTKPFTLRVKIHYNVAGKSISDEIPYQLTFNASKSQAFGLTSKKEVPIRGEMTVIGTVQATTVQDTNAPVITAITPSSGVAGDTFTITGTNLSNVDSIIIYKGNNLSNYARVGSPTTKSSTSLTFVLSSSAVSGLGTGGHKVVVSTNNVQSNMLDFAISGDQIPTPVISSVSSTKTDSYTKITINGSNLYSFVKIYDSNKAFFGSYTPTTYNNGTSIDLYLNPENATKLGTNTISLTVSNSANIESNPYYFNLSNTVVSNQPGISSDLSSLVISGSPTNYAFSGTNYSYSGLTVPNNISSVTVTPIGSGVITVNGTTVSSGSASSAISLSEGTAKTITVIVTETGKTAKTYTISITRLTAANSVFAISKIEPSSTPAGSSIKITGTNLFGVTAVNFYKPGLSSIYFSQVNGNFNISSNGTELTFSLGSAIVPGTYDVTVSKTTSTLSNKLSSGLVVTGEAILAPSNISVSPSSVPKTDNILVTVSGSNLGHYSTRVNIYSGTNSYPSVNVGSFNSQSASSLSFYLSSDTLTNKLITGTNKLSVSNVSGESAKVDFIITSGSGSTDNSGNTGTGGNTGTTSGAPVITSISPNSGKSGSTIVVSGTNLAKVVTIDAYLNGVYKGSFAPNSYSNTSIPFTINNAFAVNATAGTYQLKAVTDTGTTSNSMDFVLTEGGSAGNYTTPNSTMTISSISPSEVKIGVDTAITVKGNNLGKATGVRFYKNGQVTDYNYIFGGAGISGDSTNGYTFTINSLTSSVMGPGVHSFSLSENSSPSARTAPVSFTITGSALPVPVIKKVTPTTMEGGHVYLTIEGENLYKYVYFYRGTEVKPAFNVLSATVSADAKTATMTLASQYVSSLKAGVQPIYIAMANIVPTQGEKFQFSLTSPTGSLTLSDSNNNLANVLEALKALLNSLAN